MEVWVVLTTFVLGLLLLVTIWRLLRGDTKRKANPYNIPGPTSSDPNLGNLGDCAKAGSLHAYLLQLHEEYGGVACFWWCTTPVVSVRDPKIFREMVHMWDRPKMLFELFEPFIGTKCIQYANGDDIRNRRALLDPCLSAKTLEGMPHQTFVTIAKATAEKWKEAATIEGSTTCMNMALTAILRVSMGELFVSEGEVDSLRRSYQVCWHEMEVRLGGSIPEEGSGRAKAFSTHRENLRGLIRRAVVARRDGIDTGSVLLDVLLEHFPEDQMLDDALAYIVGGSHTTGNSLVWLLYYLSIHPGYQDRVREELSGLGLVGRTARDPVSGDLNKMSFLDKCLKETLRCMVIAPYAAREMEEDVVLGGYPLSKGTPVIQALGATLQCKEIWGNPEVYDPDRKSPPFAAQAFGIGKRICPGYSYANWESKVFLAVLLGRYRVTLVPGQTVTPVYGLVCSPKDEIMFSVEEIP